ncbi:MAG: hypothetical protein IJU19_04660 [Bacteroidales bacterium]|nr:hypothetical protein [Bacteroidales bacterium]
MEYPKQVAAVSLARAANAAHFDFMAQVLRRIEAHQAGPSRWHEASGEFASAVEAEDAAFKLYQASLMTPSIKDADERRDAAYRSLNAAVEAFASFPIAEMAEMGQQLKRVLKNYKVDVNASYQKESGLVANLLDDLDSEAPEALDGLQLRSLADALREANDEVRRLIDERSEDRAGQASGMLKAARAETDRAYALLVLMTNATLALEPDDTEAKWLVEVMQEDIDYFRRYNMTSHGSNGSGSDSGTDTPTPTPSDGDGDDPVSAGDGTDDPIAIGGDPGLPGN